MENKTLLATILVLALVSVCLTGYTLWFGQGKTEIKEVKVPVLTAVPYNDTALSNKVDAISLAVNKDDAWKSNAKEMALSEIKDNKYKDLYNYLVSQNVSIVDREDINSVVIKDSEVTSFDVENQDADVSYELKVYYEDADGTDKKVYVDAEVVIKDNEVDDLTYSL